MTIQNQPHRQFASSCVLCGGTGWVNAIQRVTHNHYAFRCQRCGSASNKGLSKSIPDWSDDYKKNYELFANYSARAGWKDVEKGNSTEDSK